MITNNYNIETIKLSYFIKQKNERRGPNKIDTKGHELSVLKVEKEIKIIKHILIEFHNNKIYQL